MMIALTDRGVIAIAGNDRVEFLNGLISQDVTKVTPEQPLYGCLLTPQGKYFADFFIIMRDEQILLDVAASRVDAVINRLNMFVLRSKVTITHVSADYHAYAHRDTILLCPDLVYQDPRRAAIGNRIIGQFTCETDATLEDYHAWRIQNGVPDITDFDLERTALLEANLDLLHGIAWDKGCYMGQELTARTHYRGLVKKRLLPFVFHGAVPAFDSELRLGDQVIGHTRSTAGSYGMALVKLEFADAAWNGGCIINDMQIDLLKPEWFTF